MVRRLTVGLVVWAVLAALFVAIPDAAGAHQEEERLEQVEGQIRDLERQLAAARNNRSEFAAQLVATQKRIDEVHEVLHAAEAALAEIAGAIATQERQIAELQRKVQILQAQIAETQLEQRSTRGLIRSRAVELYMNGSNTLGGIGFGVDDVESASVGLEYAGNVLLDTRVLLRSLEVLEQQEATQQGLLESEKAREEAILVELEADRVTAEAHRATVEESRAEIQAELDAQQALLDKVNAEISQYESHVGRLEAESRELEREIARRQVREGAAPGRLSWPVPGPVTSAYGWRVHPIFGTRKLHTGIDLAGSTGQSIRAAGNGTVILASTWGGYGRTVIIDHGGGLSTLYAHQSSIKVSLGQTVSAGDVIGSVGCSGYCTGAHLHFETRVGGSPVNPMQYLGG